MDADDALRRHRTTYWRDWIGALPLRRALRDAVRRASITLKALTYAPTGGIVAAATTSLPEQLGGVRNWDYRYCWLRDATFTLQALLGTGLPAEARAWRDWLLRAVAGDPADLQIMYGLDGARRLPEYELAWLPGYGGSTPGAGRQRRRRASSSSTCTVRCSTACTSRAPGLHADDAAWDAAARAAGLPREALAAARRRASGRSAARAGTSCTRR